MSDKKQDFPSYKIVYAPGTGEVTEKKSRFIADVAPAENEEEAAAFIEAVRRKYYDARHHCPAYIIGRNKEYTKCSDDGEPQGTAGKPILEVLNAAEVTNTVIVVTRYFGGTLLGTGGLVRAYTEAAKAGLANAGIATMRYGAEILIRTEYTDLGKIQYLLGNKGIPVLNSSYADKVELTVKIPAEKTDSLLKELAECTCARAVPVILSQGYYRE